MKTSKPSAAAPKQGRAAPKAGPKAKPEVPPKARRGAAPEAAGARREGAPAWFRGPRHRHSRRARAQSEERRSHHPARQARRLHRPFGLGQVLARLRHDLCRGPAPLCRIALGLCAAVSGDDAEARRRPDRRALAGDFDRAEDDVEKPALDRRHRHRNLRLHAAAVGARRHSLFAGDRPADRKPDGQPDGRSRARAAGAHAALSAGAGRSAAARANIARKSPTS